MGVQIIVAMQGHPTYFYDDFRFNDILRNSTSLMWRLSVNFVKGNHYLKSNIL